MDAFSALTPTYNTYKNYIWVIQTPENLYITKVWKNGYTLYESNNIKLKPVLTKIEIILFKKFQVLLTKKKITQLVYNNTVSNYNNFILYLTIFRDTKNKESKEKWKYFLSELIKIYSIK